LCQLAGKWHNGTIVWHNNHRPIYNSKNPIFSGILGITDGVSIVPTRYCANLPASGTIGWHDKQGLRRVILPTMSDSDTQLSAADNFRSFKNPYFLMLVSPTGTLTPKTKGFLSDNSQDSLELR
jgi:hypothetical protein